MCVEQRESKREREREDKSVCVLNRERVRERERDVSFESSFSVTILFRVVRKSKKGKLGPKTSRFFFSISKNFLTLFDLLLKCTESRSE